MVRPDLSAACARSGAAVLLAVLAAGGAHAACDAPVFSLAASVQRSDWREYDSSGARLVHERGDLPGLSASANGRCGDTEWQATLGRQRGNRDYDGSSNTGVPLATRSHIVHTWVEAQGFRPAIGALALGVRLQVHRIDRDIASAGTVLGYPERFTYWQAALGARYPLASPGGMLLSAYGWLGAGPGGNLDVQIPGTDAATLRLGRTVVTELGLRLDSPPTQSAGWSWSGRLGWMQDRMSAGRAQALTHNGIPVAAAQQPRTRQSGPVLEAGVRYRF